MAQAGFTPISLYFSSTAAAVPTAGNLANGELALNIADMKLYAKNSAGAVTLLASSGGASGTVSSVAVSGGTTGLTTSGGPITTSGTITLAGTLGTANGGTGLTSFTSGGVVYASSSSALATGSGLVFDGTNLGIGNTSPTSYNGAADNLVIGTSGNNGMTIVSGSTSSGYIMFADGTTGQQQYEGQITYDHTNNFMALSTNGTEKLRLDSAGNLGLGVTPSAWASYKAFQFGPAVADGAIASAGNDSNFATNCYFNSGWKYQSTGYAPVRYVQTSGVHQWYTAASGTAGNAISFTQAMTLDASGNLLIGSTANANSARLKSKVSGGSVGFEVTDEASSDFVVVPASSAGVCKIGPTAGAMSFQTAGTERARINSSGAWSFGSSGTNTGTAGQVLTSGGASAAPTWAAAAGGGGQVFAAFGGIESVFASQGF